MFARLHRIEINAAVRTTAGGYSDPLLHSLDAIHLATAELLAASGKSVSAFVTYDKRLVEAAAQAGLPVATPGRPRQRAHPAASRRRWMETSQAAARAVPADHDLMT